MLDEYDEIPKHKKRKTSKTIKSNHKHQYEKCLFDVEGKFYVGKICRICGKIGDIEFFQCSKDGESRYPHFMSNKEIKDKYKELPTFKLQNICQKYI